MERNLKTDPAEVEPQGIFNNLKQIMIRSLLSVGVFLIFIIGVESFCPRNNTIHGPCNSPCPTSCASRYPARVCCPTACKGYKCFGTAYRLSPREQWVNPDTHK